MSTATLTASANHISSSGTINYYNGSANYAILSDSDDNTFLSCAGSSAYVLMPVYGTTPSDIGSVTAIQINIRTVHTTKGDISDVYKLQLFKSNGTTAISSEITIAPFTIATSIANYSFNPSVTLSGQSDWNDCCLKITTDSGTVGTLVHEASVGITYTPETSSDEFNYTATGELTLGEKSVFKVTFDLVTIIYNNNLNYNFIINAFKSRTILKSHMRIY